MPIKISDIGPDDVTARRILIRAREVAPCISTFAEGSEEYLDAVAILRGVYGRAAAIGAVAVASQSRNGTSITFREVKSAFDADDLSGLRSLCSVTGADTRRGLPAGSFPLDRPLGRVFPEGPYS